MQFKSIVDNSVETQYMIELYAAGCVDNPLCTNEATKARLSALRKEAQFWRDPKGTWQRTDFSWSVTYEDLRNTSWDDNLWIRFKKTFSAEEGKWNALQCVLFQPLEGGIPIAERWELSFPFSFVCVTGNPSESMVVLLDVETDSTSLKENYVYVTLLLIRCVLLTDFPLQYLKSGCARRHSAVTRYDSFQM